MSFPLLSTRFRSPAVDMRPFREASVHKASRENTISLYIIEILRIQNGSMVLHTHTHVYVHSKVAVYKVTFSNVIKIDWVRTLQTRQTEQVRQNSSRISAMNPAAVGELLKVITVSRHWKVILMGYMC